MILQGRLLTIPERAPQPGWVRVENGHVAEIGEGRPPDRADAGGETALICPAFVDAHIHLPQIDSIGCESTDLLAWLDEVIFPAEARWLDADAARLQTRTAYRRMLRAGTLAYAGYLTSHATGLDAVESASTEVPLRAIAGQVLMDQHAPDALLGHAVASVERSSSPHVRRSVNPRFAVTCSRDLLHRAGASGAGGFIQTHLAETVAECERVRKLHAGPESYTALYDQAGMLHERTLLAHCIHLEAGEWRTIAERRSVVVHCPGANTFLRAGQFDLVAAKEAGVRLALGSDVAAGPDLAMPRVARAMIEVAKSRSLWDRTASVPTPAEAWHLITAGNSEALELQRAGRLEIGAPALLNVLDTPLEVDQHLIGRLLYTWRDDYISHRVLGDRLYGADLQPLRSVP